MTRLRATLAALVVAALQGCGAPGAGSGRLPGAAAGADRCDDPEALAAWREARGAIERGDDAAALPLLKLACQRCPDLVRAHCAYQDVARRLGGRAAEEMVAAYAAASGGGAPVPAYLRARLAETAYAQANDLKKILAEHPGFAWAHLSLARVNRGQGRLSESLGGFRLAARSDASLIEATLERGQVLAELGRGEEAAVAYQAYLAARPADDEAAREFVALLLYGLGRSEAALEWIGKLEASGDRSVALRMDRAAAYWRMGQPRAAAAGYLAVLADEPRNARAALNVGLLYYEIVPKDDAGRDRFWPGARAAFRMFLANTAASDGYEQFERTWAVPHRLRQIAERIGAAPEGPPTLPELRWPEQG
jgi:tetratricopeptide (TPR) repeat protein